MRNSVLLILILCAPCLSCADDPSKQTDAIRTVISFYDSVQSQDFDKAVNLIDSGGIARINAILISMADEETRLDDLSPAELYMTAKFKRDYHEDISEATPSDYIKFALRQPNRSTNGHKQWETSAIQTDHEVKRISVYHPDLPEIKMLLIEENEEWRLQYSGLVKVVDQFIEQIAANQHLSTGETITYLLNLEH